VRALLMSVAVALCGGCGTVDAVLDCNAICQRYRSCFESGYDVGSCEARCRNNSSEDRDYRRRADQCNACIDDRSCASSTFNCAGQCTSIVP
jgi:hypothetical protein